MSDFVLCAVHQLSDFSTTSYLSVVMQVVMGGLCISEALTHAEGEPIRPPVKCALVCVCLQSGER